VGETAFDELKRYVRFGAGAEAALRAFAPLAAPHFEAIVDAFYARIVAARRRTVVCRGEYGGGKAATGEVRS